MIPVNDLGRAVRAHRADLDAAIARVLDSGWFVMGPEHDAFEREFAAFLGVDDAVAVANGTDALMLALAAAGCVPGDRVLTVANAGGYTSTACRALGLEPVYVDVEPDTLLLAAERLRAALSVGPRAVVVTHLFGAMAPMPEIMTVADAAGVTVIEDCAQSIGARWDGRSAGSFGRLAAFSFYPTKNLGALGDGGAVVTSDAQLSDRVRSLRQYGWRGRYRTVDPGGRNSRLDEIQAALLRVRLQWVDADNERRRQIHAAYAAALPGGRYRMVHASSAASVAHLIVMSCGTDREFVRDLLRDNGVMTDVHYPICDHRQPLVADTYRDISLPVSEAGAASVLTLPSFPELSDAEVGRVCSALAEL